MRWSALAVFGLLLLSGCSTHKPSATAAGAPAGGASQAALGMPANDTLTHMRFGGETEEQLKKKTIPELQTLAQYARVKVLDFSGRGVPVERNASSKVVNYAPPNPYEPGLEKMRAAENR